MSGKRLLDLAALFNASRGVVQKHIALRSRQLDVYNKTSTLSRAVKSQTDRITETAKAASFLASRMNEGAPSWTSEAAGEGSTDKSSNIPSKESVTANHTQPTPEEKAVGQDHFYKPSVENSALDDPPTSELKVEQRQAPRYPLPDGTIPTEQSNYDTPSIDKDITSMRPKTEPSQQPIGKSGLQPASSNRSSIPKPAKALSPNEARTKQRQSEAQIPSETADALEESFIDPLEDRHDKDTFYHRPGHTSPTLSSLPRVKIPKHVSDIQMGDSHIPTGEIDSDVYYSSGESREQSKIPIVEAIPLQKQKPRDLNSEIFTSPEPVDRTSTSQSQNVDLKLEGVKDTPLDKSKSSLGIDQDSFNSLDSEQNQGTASVDQQSKLPEVDHEVTKLAREIAAEVEDKPSKSYVEKSPKSAPYELRESKVPSSRLGRLWNYGGLAAGMLGGAVSESIRRVSGSGGEGSYMLTSANMDRLVTKLSRMRGAALKLGQVISFQDSKMLPPAIQEVLQRVQDRADYMPASQRNKVLGANLGENWRELFTSFEDKPLAAASIGQVHSAVLKSNGARVAVKIQYPGVADSIDSDLNNLTLLLTASRLLPKGLFLDKTIANARTELAWECDYTREAQCGRRFAELLADETDTFIVPKVYSEASGKQVLTMEFMDGVGVTRVQNFTQEQKDWIGTNILRLCLREIVEFQYMQTDPNWTNFLFNAATNKLELLDFGATREYPEEFITRYVKLLDAASRSEKDVVRTLSIELGYLTGHESKKMLDAHITSILTLAEPFLDSSPEVYDFRDQTITERVKALIPVMINERLSPPPEETYSLHRKLSGAFLLCARLGSRVPCRQLFQDSMAKAGLR